jgi:hypothetical protein
MTAATVVAIAILNGLPMPLRLRQVSIATTTIRDAGLGPKGQAGL